MQDETAGGPDGAPTDVHEHETLVHSRAQIHATLARLRDARELTAVQFGTRGEFVVTVVLAVDAVEGTFLVDVPSDPEMHERLLTSGPLLLLAHIGGIRVQFRVDGAVDAIHEGGRALRMAFPAAVARFERRASFRVRIPRTRVVLCELPPQAEVDVPMVRVVDLSCEGAALHPGDEISLEPGTQVPPCRLRFDDEPAVEVGLEIRRVAEDSSFSGESQRIVGARFVGLNPAAEARIARYLNRLQREARRAESLAELPAPKPRKPNGR